MYGYAVHMTGQPSCRYSSSSSRDKGTDHSVPPAIQYVGVDFCGTHITVPQLFLDGANVGATFQQVSCETVTQGVAAGILVDVCRAHCPFYGPLQALFTNVMPAYFSAALVEAPLLGWKQVLPGIFKGCPWVFLSRA